MADRIALVELHDFLKWLGTRETEVEDHEEETFLLFSQNTTSHDLGFVDPKSATIQVAVGEHDLEIHQSPTILTSDRGGGTTGAVVWKITPIVASWMILSTNLFFKHGILDSDSTVLELGCGISGIIGLVLSPLISTYVLTDQEYVLKLLNRNLLENQSKGSSSTNRKRGAQKSKSNLPASSITRRQGQVIAKTLDWERDVANASLAAPETKRSFDAVIACDCVYNDALIEPFVGSCVDVCMLRKKDISVTNKPTVCIVAQQLRSAEVFEAWLKAFQQAFRVWRVPDDELTVELQSGTGFVVHIGILR